MGEKLNCVWYIVERLIGGKGRGLSTLEYSNPSYKSEIAKV